jgi:hypothetical protein
VAGVRPFHGMALIVKTQSFAFCGMVLGRVVILDRWSSGRPAGDPVALKISPVHRCPAWTMDC